MAPSSRSVRAALLGVGVLFAGGVPLGVARESARVEPQQTTAQPFHRDAPAAARRAPARAPRGNVLRSLETTVRAVRASRVERALDRPLGRRPTTWRVVKHGRRPAVAVLG